MKYIKQFENFNQTDVNDTIKMYLLTIIENADENSDVYKQADDFLLKFKFQYIHNKGFFVSDKFIQLQNDILDFVKSNKDLLQYWLIPIGRTEKVYW